MDLEDPESEAPLSQSCLINTCQKPERESIDSKLLEVERKIKHIRQTPSEASIRARIHTTEAELADLEAEVQDVRQRPDYLGKAGLKQIERLKKQFARQQHLYWLRKRACFDLVEVFSELHQEDPEVFKAKAGLNEDDYDDKPIQELLDVYNEVKLGLDGDQDEEDGEEESEDDYDGEEEEDEAMQEEEKAD